jgi:transcriptional regulator with XRE-family HTH domain
VLKSPRMQQRRRDTVEMISKRLVRTRLALGFQNQSDFARRAGLGVTTYNNYEHGHRIGLDAALDLCVKFNLSLDWIYFGDPVGLPHGIAQSILGYATEDHAAPRPKRRGRPFTKAS